MSLSGLLRGDTVTVRRMAPVAKDTSAGPKRAYADLYTAVPGRLQDLSAGAITAYAMRQMLVSHQFFTEQSGIRVSDHLVDSDGRTLDVTGVSKRRGGLGTIQTFYVVLCNELRPGV